MMSRRVRRPTLPAVLAVLLAALPGTIPGSNHAARAQGAMSEPTHAQPELGRQTLTIVSRGGAQHEFSVELARTPREQQVGEMFRTVIPANTGMLFVWPYPQQSDMWMENCPVPEDMVFIGTDDRIQSIAENTVPESLARISSNGVVKATLELQGGITAKLGIRVGDQVENKALDAARG